MALPNIGNAIGIVFSWFSPEAKIKRLKDEKDKLNREKAELLKGVCDAKKANRIIAINTRIDIINGLLQNSANG